MKDLKKVLSFDFHLLKKNWVPFLVFAILFTIMLVYCLVPFYDGRVYDGENRQAVLLSLIERRDELAAAFEAGEVPPSYYERFSEELRLLNFYIDTSTIPSDYVEPTSLLGDEAHYIHAAFGARSLFMGFIFLLAYVPFFSSKVIFSHFSFGQKNVLMAPIKRKTLLFADGLCVFILTLIPLVAFLSMAGVGFFGDQDALVLVDRKDGYFNYYVSLFFLSGSLSMLVFSFLVFAITFIFYILFRRDYVAYAAPALITIVILVLCMLISFAEMKASSLVELGLVEFSPIVGLFTLTFYPTSFGYYLSLGLHAVAAVLLIIISSHLYHKRGYV